MTINRPEDVDLARIVRLLPPSAYTLRAFTAKLTVKVSREFPTFSVRLRRDGPEMQINPDFAEEYIETEYDLAMATFHEWLHVLREHLNPRRVGLTFGFDVHTHEDFLKLPPKTFALIRWVQELEIKHLEHLLMPDDHFHDLNRRYYADSDDAKIRLLYRGSDPAAFDDVYYEALHERIFSRGLYSTREAFYLLQEREEEMEDDGEGESEEGQEGQEGEEGDEASGGSQPGKGKGPPMIESDSGVDADVPQETIDDIMEAFDQLLEKARQEANKPEDQPVAPEEKKPILSPHVEHVMEEQEKAKEEDDSKSKATRPDSSAGTGTMFDEEVKERAKVARNRRLEQAVKRVRTKPNYLARVTAAFSRQTAKARSRSTVPNYLTDRRAQRDYVTGKYRAKFLRRKGPSEELFALYFDISYSQDAYIPHCNEVVLQLKHLFVDRTVFVFSDYVVDVPISDFVRRAKAGTVTSLVRTRGTNFSAVAEHAAKNGFRQLAVLTDNACWLSDENMAPLTKRSDFYLLLIDTTGSAHAEYYANGREEGGFVPYMSERIFIDPST